MWNYVTITTCVFYIAGVTSIPIEAIPGIAETGWRPAARATRGGQMLEESQDVDTLAGLLKSVLDSVTNIWYT